jgi:hypothetical protein
MIAFHRASIWQRLVRLWPARRRQQDADMAAAIAYLVDNPDAPCVVEGQLIPHGYGEHST